MSTDDKDDVWETQVQVDAVLSAYGVPDTRHVRWRSEDGLLPPVWQKQIPFRGSQVFYPRGYCAQLTATAELMQKKASVSYVGRELWLRGFLVHDRYWLPWLTATAKSFDRTLKKIIGHQDEDSASTLADRLAKRKFLNIIASRIVKRVSGSALATVYGVALDVAVGRFEGFETLTDRQKTTPRQTHCSSADNVIAAMDIGQSKTQHVLGQHLNFQPMLEPTLTQLATAFRAAPLGDVLKMDRQTLFQARNDALNALTIGLCLYEATSWIYGEKSFGLRLLARIARNRPEWFLPYVVLAFARLRATSTLLLSSEEIATLADEARKLRDASLTMKSSGKTDPRLQHVFSPKRVRAALVDSPALNRFQLEIQKAVEPA